MKIILTKMKPLPLIIYSLTLLLLGIWIGIEVKPERPQVEHYSYCDKVNGKITCVVNEWVDL